MEEVTEIMPESTEITPEEKQNGIYCIKCRSHTDNINEREDIITSKSKPRNVIKADCATCGKKKNRFVKSAKPIEDSFEDLYEKPIKVKQIRAKRVDELIEEDKSTTDGKTTKKVTFNLKKKSDKKLLDALLEKYMNDFNLNQTSLN